MFMKLVFQAVRKIRRHGRVVATRLQYISNCVMVSGRVQVKNRSSGRTSLRLTSWIIVTGATRSRSADAVMTIDFGFESICKLQTR